MSALRGVQVEVLPWRPTRRSGETGRHAALKTPCALAHAGSIPAIGTAPRNTDEDATTYFELLSDTDHILGARHQDALRADRRRGRRVHRRGALAVRDLARTGRAARAARGQGQASDPLF